MVREKKNVHKHQWWRISWPTTTIVKEDNGPRRDPWGTSYNIGAISLPDEMLVEYHYGETNLQPDQQEDNRSLIPSLIQVN